MNEYPFSGGLGKIIFLSLALKFKWVETRQAMSYNSQSNNSTKAQCYTSLSSKSLYKGYKQSLYQIFVARGPLGNSHNAQLHPGFRLCQAGSLSEMPGGAHCIDQIPNRPVIDNMDLYWKIEGAIRACRDRIMPKCSVWTQSAFDGLWCFCARKCFQADKVAERRVAETHNGEPISAAIFLGFYWLVFLFDPGNYLENWASASIFWLILLFIRFDRRRFYFSRCLCGFSLHFWICIFG